MATPFFPRLRPGATPTAADFNALADALAASVGVGGQAMGDIGVAQSHGGLQLLDGREKSHWAKIGERGTGAAYAHVSAAPDGDGTFTDLAEVPEYPWGTATDQPAREVNGDENVTEGRYYRLWPDPIGNGWLFNAGASGEDSTPSGCPPPGIDPAECLVFAVTAGAGRCADIAAGMVPAALSGGWWTATGPLAVGDGENGTIAYRVSPTTSLIEMKITVDAVAYWGMPAGCDADGRPRFAFGGTVLCADGTPSTESCDNLFHVAVGCVPCGYDECTGWYCWEATQAHFYVRNCDEKDSLLAALAGDPVDPEDIPTCAEAPERVRATLNSTAACLGSRSAEFDRVGAGPGYTYPSVIGNPNDLGWETCGLDLGPILTCSGDTWSFAHDTHAFALVAASKTPFTLVFEWTGTWSGTGGTGTTYVTITAAP